jgi:hypothetical protein
LQDEIDVRELPSYKPRTTTPITTIALYNTLLLPTIHIVYQIPDIMPALPFNSAATPSSSPSSSPTLSPTTTPSIVLHPASGIFDQPLKPSVSLIVQAGVSSQKELHKPKEDPAQAYRIRYAQYLAATFGFSMQAALSEADSQLAPRRSSNMSEAESLRAI